MRPCLDCGTLAHASRCRACLRDREYHRNRQAKRQGYRNPVYLAQPRTGICWVCKKPGADTRDHVVPLAIDPTSTLTRPAHRSCNSARGARSRT